MNTCQICGKEISSKQNNQTNCASCTGKMGGRPHDDLKDKAAKINKAGYLYYNCTMLSPSERALVPTDGRSVLVHRLIMAKKLGRPLLKGEVVMHIDGNKQNNNPDNLMIGDQFTNIRQHWEARQDAENWKKIAVMMLFLIYPHVSY